MTNTPNNKEIEIFTDGCCLGNPGPGGYGIVLIYGDNLKELSQGFAKTTNNRMELLACIVALQALKEPCKVTLTSDSKYVVDAINKGWAKKWQANNWKRNKKDRAENSDLWQQLLALNNKHQVQYQWVRGHAGHPENERCDELAKAAAQQDDLLVDEGYKR